MDQSFLAITRCARCKEIGRLKENRAATCESCGAEFATSGGYLDLLDSLTAGATIGAPPPATSEQRLMESPLLARVYEGIWRPVFVRVIAGRGAGGVVGGAAGEWYIHKHSLGVEERQGPWLDVSCGPGTFTRALAASSPGALVIGLDISQAMLEVAATRVLGYNNVHLVRADAHALPFGDASMGGINNVGALHAYDDPDEVFSEMKRVLRPGGVLVGSTFSDATSALGRVVAKIAGVRRFTPGVLRSWLQRVGFADYEDVRLGGAFIFRARKP